MAENTRRAYRQQDDSHFDSQAGHDPVARLNDPLAELARLIGQTDPFVEFRKDLDRPTPGRTQQTQVAPADDEDDADWNSEADDFDDQPYQPQPVQAQPTQPQPAPVVRHGRAMPSAQQVRPMPLPQVQRPMVAPQPVPMHEARPPQGEADARQYYAALQNAYPAQEPQEYDDEDLDSDQDETDYQEYYDDPPQQRSHTSKLTIAAILCLAFVGTGGALAYRSFSGGATHSNQPPPIIHADTAPTKIVPTVASSDGPAAKPITDRLGGKGGERVVPREEQPVEMREQKQAQPRMLFPTVSAPESTASTTNPRMSPLDEPKKIRTVPIRPDAPDGSGVSGSHSTQNSASRSAPAQRSAPPAPAPQPQRPASPISLAPEATTTPQRTQTASLAPVAPSSGNYLVQVSSQRSESEAQSAYRSLQGRYAMLASRSAVIRRVDLGEKGTFYRAMVGPFASSDEAAQFCTQLRSSGGQCLIQRN